MLESIKYSDNLLVPEESLKINYKGKNCMRIFQIIQPVLMETMEIDSPKFYEDIALWDGNDGKFRGVWRAKKPFDRWTTMWVAVNAWGKIDLRDPDKKGVLTLKIKPYLQTEVDYATDIQKGLWWVYSLTFYNEHRRKLMTWGLDFFRQIRDRILREYGIELIAPPAPPR